MIMIIIIIIITYFGHNEVLSMISYIEKNIEEMLCVLKKGKQKLHFDRKIPFHD